MDKSSYRTLVPLFDELRGERIIVRPYRQADARSLHEAIDESRDHLRPWLPFADGHQSVEESLDWIIQQMARWLLREEMTCGMWEAADPGRFLGGIGLHVRNWSIRSFEIGYWLRRSAEGGGYVTEAARLLTAFALDSLQANRVEIRCDELNSRSAAVPIRLGFTREGLLRNQLPGPDGSPRNTLVFSLIPADSRPTEENR